ncbi:MAG: transglutaminase-like domain-containing protein [Oscillospiraceae bacterium]|nr:transglutaminase-like domain-containing protein [Oscillospiraceae bacterium]
MKINIKKVNKKKPIFINPECEETRAILVFRIAVKVLLVCMATAGLCTTLAQLYRVPVSLFAVTLVSISSVIVFNLGLIFFKKRAILIPLLFFFMLWGRNVVRNLAFFSDHIFYTLDSRLLTTAHYARIPLQTLLDNSDYVSSAFLMICILISLGFTLAARSRFIGIILVSAVFAAAPAFGAEIAGYAVGMEIMLAGMLGIYSMWVAHAWESMGRVLRLCHPNEENKEGLTQESVEELRHAKPKKMPPKSKEPFYKIAPGRIPHFYKYSRNSLLTLAIAIFAAFTASSAVPGAIKFDYRAIIDSISNMWQSTVDFFSGASPIEDNGYFPNIASSSNTEISQGISLDNPPTGQMPIIRVRLEDDSEKIFLRGGIGIDFTGSEWSITQDSQSYRNLIRLLQYYSPESEYQLFRQMSDGYYRGEYVMGIQNISIEYLRRTGFLLLPTQPLDYTGFKFNTDYRWYLDTYIRAANNKIKRTEFEVIYPRMSKFFEISQAYHYISEASLVDLTPEVMDYRNFIHEVYTHVPESEIENMDRFAELVRESEIRGIDDFASLFAGSRPPIGVRESDLYSSLNIPFVYTHFLNYAQRVHNYLRANYTYSLETDNNAGDNTTIGNFLFETGQGHCAMYATAMTLAMRQYGIPARYVTGIVTVKNDGKVQEFAERDFHAWVEVYFDGIGWLPFDPTGGAHGQELADYVADDSYSETATATLPVSETSHPPIESEPPVTTLPETAALTESNTSGMNARTITAIVIVAGSLLLLVLLVSAFSHSLRNAEISKFARYKNTVGNETAAEMYRFMFRLLKVAGIEALNGEPPLTFGERVDKEMPLGDFGLSAVMPIFEKLEFGNSDLTSAEHGMVYEYISALYNAVVVDNKATVRLVRRVWFLR